METRKGYSLEECLEAVSGLPPERTDGYFLARLLARMERRWAEASPACPVALKPAWVLGFLLLLLGLNLLSLSTETGLSETEAVGAVEDLAASYDQDIVALY